jgi:peptide chain release factor 1
MSASGLPQATLDQIVRRHEALQSEMATGAPAPEAFVRMSKEYAELTPVVEGIGRYRQLERELADLEVMAADSSADAEMRAMAQDELLDVKQKLPAAIREVQLLLLPKDDADEKNAILEVRAGTGGGEAALFASDLFAMYRGYAAIKGWRFEVLSISETDLSGYREAVATISGRGVFARLKFESGVHRVQRVPVTEGSGRIHTSTATVAVLPEVEEVDVKIDEKDLRIDVFRSSGPGGQSVNTTDSAVRITHLPTGLVVSQQDEKSQHKNKAKALKILRARLYDMERSAREAERADARRGQVGSGDRSERVRTYNFPQGRVTDHRIGLTLYKIDQVITGEALDEIVEALVADDQAQRLAMLES